jgi:hypothetical protein
MSAGQCSRTIPEGLDIKANPDNGVGHLIGLTYPLLQSLYLPVLPSSYCIRGDH